MTTSIEQAVTDLQAGKFLIIVDDEERENEGDLLIAADHATPQKLNFMIQKARGLMCMPINPQRLDELKIPNMVDNPDDTFQTPFTVSVDAKNNVTTGMSVHDRMQTINTILNPKTKPEDLARPGHMFPLRASKGGVQERPGHTEAAVDLCKLANLTPISIIAEIMNEEGEMAKLPELKAFAKEHNINIVAIKEIISYLSGS